MAGCGWLVSGMSVSVGMRGRLASPRRAISCTRHGRWYASIVLVCQPERSRGVDTIAFDWGVETFATIASTG